MSDPQTVREAITTKHSPPHEGIVVADEHVYCALGIDPDMPLETLKRRLLWGERVEVVAGPLPVDGSRKPTLAWLTREEA